MKRLFKITFSILIFLTLTLNCKNQNDFKNYKLTNAYVYEVQKKHWGKGFYNLTIQYEYQIENKKFKGEFKPEGKVRNYSSKWLIGDSVLIKYNPDSIEESKFIERIFSKPRIE